MPARPTEDRLVRKGRDVPLAALAQQARASIQLARAHDVGLARYGWTHAHTDALAVRADALGRLAGERRAHLSATKAATRREVEARRAAMRFLRHLRTALPLALKAARAEDAASTFLAGAPLGRSTPKVIAYLAKIAPAVGRIDAELAPYFPGERPAAALARVLDALLRASADRERIHAEIPMHTDRVHRLGGELLEGIEDLHRVARLAFDGEPLVREAFSKRWIERGRKRRPAGEMTPAPPVAAA